MDSIFRADYLLVACPLLRGYIIFKEVQAAWKGHPLKGRSRKKHLSIQKSYPFLLVHNARMSTVSF